MNEIDDENEEFNDLNIGDGLVAEFIDGYYRISIDKEWLREFVQLECARILSKKARSS